MPWWRGAVALMVALVAQRRALWCAVAGGAHTFCSPCEQNGTLLEQWLIKLIAKPVGARAAMLTERCLRADVFRFGNVSSVVFR